jgi:hypothetical protein
MKLPGRLRYWALACVAMTIVASAWGISAMRESRDNDKVKKMISKMKTVCVGRMLIDLPEMAEVSFGAPSFGGINIQTEAGYTEEQLKSEVEQREKTLAAEKNEYGSPSLEKKVVADAVNFKTTLFYFARTKPLTYIEYGKPVQGREQGISVESLGIKDGIFYRIFADDVASPRAENYVIELVEKFEARNSASIPQQSGFCVENGLVHDPLTPDDNEAITMFASLKGHPDIVIRLDTSINVKAMEEPLLEREAKNSVKRDYASHFKSLRRGARSINGINGEEVGDKVKELNGTSAHSFMWVGLGKMRDVLAPAITLELHTGRGRPGEPRNSSLSDDAVMQLWDRISSSLRLRPTSPANTSSAPKTKLGEVSLTGNPCPQTGYWECAETGNVDGGRRRFIQEGVHMPHAKVRPAPTLWQKLSGNHPVQIVRTTWTLVAYDEILTEQLKAPAGQPTQNGVADGTDPNRPASGGPDVAGSDDRTT